MPCIRSASNKTIGDDVFYCLVYRVICSDFKKIFSYNKANLFSSFCFNLTFPNLLFVLSSH